MPYSDPEAARKYNREYQKRRYHADARFRKQVLKRTRRNEDLRRVKVDQILAEFRKNGCALCPEKEPCCMSAHHLDPGSKDFPVGEAKAIGVSLKRLQEELKKCICVCENCHRKIHAGLISAVVAQSLVEAPV